MEKTKLSDETISSKDSFQILDFDIDLTGFSGLFDSNCKYSSNVQSTWAIENCTTVQCNTVNCTTINCTTINCTTINCNTVRCTAVRYTEDSNCSTDK